MPSACPAAPANVHLVHALLDATDCHVRELVHTGYDGLFQGGGAFASVLTTLMTLYVALIGYQLMLGRGGLRVGDVTLSVVKLAAILSFATQWETYQAIVVRVLFDGTAQIATAMLHLDGNAGTGGDIFDRLQRAFDILSIAPPPPPPKPAGPLGALAPLTALQSLPLVGGGLKVLALKASAAMLLFFSLGILLATKVVLGVLLALGPIFIALLLFDVTRGLFEGWLRAALAFAFAPATTIFLLAVMLEILEPSLAAMVKERAATSAVSSETAYGVVLLVMVFAAVSIGLLIASASVFRSFRLPDRKPTAPLPVPLPAPPQPIAADRVITPAAQTSAAVAAMARREERLASAQGSESTVRVLGNFGGGGAAASNRDSGGPARDQTRLGDGARRIAAGRTVSGAVARRPD